MKNRIIHPAIILFLAAFILLNCSANKKEDEKPNDTTVAGAGSSGPQFKVEKSFQDQLSSFITTYIKLKDAFVSSETAKVRSAAKESGQQLANIDMNKLSGAAHNDWMTFLPAIQGALQDIVRTKDLEQQRKAFSVLSDSLYKSIKAFGLGGKEAFYEYCPMAFNNEGAYWLSDREQIQNPYFGDQMLTCGQVQEVIKF